MLILFGIAKMIDDDIKTLWCGNLPEQATEELLYELFLQVRINTLELYSANKVIPTLLT